jgi:hypothetical protein
MLGVLIDKDTPPTLSPSNSQNYEPDWSQLADEASMNADLDITDHLAPPPKVIEIDNNDDIVFIPFPDLDIFPPPTPIKSPKIEPDSVP